MPLHPMSGKHVASILPSPQPPAGVMTSCFRHTLPECCTLLLSSIASSATNNHPGELETLTARCWYMHCMHVPTALNKTTTRCYAVGAGIHHTLLSDTVLHHHMPNCGHVLHPYLSFWKDTRFLLQWLLRYNTKCFV